MTIGPIYFHEEYVKRCVNNIVPKVKDNVKIIKENAYRKASDKVNIVVKDGFRKAR